LLVVILRLTGHGLGGHIAMPAANVAEHDAR
jgi:hypothetical protein